MDHLLIAVLLSVAAWLAMGRSLVAAATLVTLLPFLSLGLSPEETRGAVSTGTGASAYKMIGRSLGAVMFIYMAMVDPRVKRDLRQPTSRLAACFAVWALASLVNSPRISLSLLRVAEWCVLYLGAVVIHSRVTREQGDGGLLRFIALSLTPILLTALYLSMTSPDAALEVRSSDQVARIGGALIDPNSLGLLGAVVAIAGLTYALTQGLSTTIRPLLGALIYLPPAGYLLMASRSRTALLAFFAGAGTLALLDARKRASTFRRVLFLLLVASLTLPFATEVIETWVLRGESREALSSATGRTEIWHALIFDSFPAAPILGHGYINLGPDGPLRVAGTNWSNAHNAFLYALASTGLGGFALITTMVLSALRSWIRIADSPLTEGTGSVMKRGLCACYITVLVDSCSSYGMVGHPSPAMYLFHVLYARAGLRR